jgi:hypothetical protein
MKERIQKRPFSKRNLLDPFSGRNARADAIANHIIIRAETVLFDAIKQGDFKEAKLYYTELLKTTKFSIVNAWKVN